MTLVILDYDKDIETALFKFAKKIGEYENNNITIYLVGEGFSSISAAEAGIYGINIIPDNAVRIFEHSRHSKAYDTHVPYEAPARLSDYGQLFDKIRESDDSHVVFLCTNSLMANDSFELASIVCIKTFTNKFWLTGENANRVVSGQINVGSFEELKQVSSVLPNIYKGNCVEVRDNLSDNDKQGLKRLIIQGIDILRCYLIAGYHLQQNNASVPGWAIQTRGEWLSLLIGAIDLRPGNVDYGHREEILESSEYRMILAHATLSVLSNYFYFCQEKDSFITLKELKEFGKSVEITPDQYLLLPPRGKDAKQDLINYESDLRGWINSDLWKQIRTKYIEDEDVV